MAEPRVRFRQDEGGNYPAWQEYELNKILIERNEPHLITEDAPQLSFTIEQGVIYPNDKKTNKRDFLMKDKDNKKFLLTELNDIIYNPANLKFGAIHRNTLGRGVVSPIYAIFHTDQNSEFIEGIVTNPKFIKRSLKYLEGSVIKLMTLKPRDFVKMKVWIPCIEEQKKIADFLSSVDEVITASEKEVANLETQKKAVMKKIFSQEVLFRKPDGSKFPEWEEKSFEDIASLITTSIDPSKAGQMHCVELEHLEQNSGRRLGYIVAEKQNSMKRLFKTGDVLFGKLRPYLRKFWLATENGCCSTEIWVLRPNDVVLSEFLLSLVSSDPFISIANTSEGTKMPRANWDLVSGVEFSVPCLEEQRLIADFLSSFDDAISAAKKELELWKVLKKGLLQQMFV